jgi:hypothetical protein
VYSSVIAKSVAAASATRFSHPHITDEIKSRVRDGGAGRRRQSARR